MVIVTHTRIYAEQNSNVICPNFYNAQRLVMSMIDDFIKVVHIVETPKQDRLVRNALFSMTPIQKARFNMEPFILDSSRDSVLRALSLHSSKDKFRGVVIDEFMFPGKYGNMNGFNVLKGGFNEQTVNAIINQKLHLIKGDVESSSVL